MRLNLLKKKKEKIAATPLVMYIYCSNFTDVEHLDPLHVSEESTRKKKKIRKREKPSLNFEVKGKNSRKKYD